MFKEYQCAKRDIDRVVITDWQQAKNCTSLFVAKIWYGNDISYAVYGYNCETKLGVRVTHYYYDEKSLICNYPEACFMVWRTFYMSK